ncbi:riboflavin synthase [Candidatus Brocadia sapporoensis]|uniref:Riboflavin synthase n=1 Tax=Candidatus Brocadia sapporoensis TaxID=392547 RepID=A0A1V6M0S9_9BACT|nr:riboflavin synthase [Candidatus Brocadia sapporoensis]MDG6006344.1 riboflavin synthase [Candidatus Brocadia sp.]OQD45975.1 riboflavin synthase [Candidatus Brocadia sapporoensis]GJQ22624.1 MAG: riboflavin synthase subunit alpha [Candidatus Brocadia sapporoensis]
MFTGIIENLASVKNLSLKAGGGELFLNFSDLYDDLVLGESIAVNGVCLTVKEISGRIVSFDVSGETLKKTTLGNLRYAENVNIERALRMGDRLGGHFVTGHVDGTGIIKEKRQSAGQCTMSFSAEKRFTDMMIEKGSVAIDGISLTIVDLSDSIFSVAVISYTLAATTLGFKKAGDPVNIEIDMMGKWIKRLLSNLQEKKGGITREQLMEQGFL